MSDQFDSELMSRSSPEASDRAVGLADISNAAVRVHKELFGRGPTKVRTQINGETVTCTLEDDVAPSAAALVTGGNGDDVKRVRDLLYEAARSELIGVVEAVTGRSVHSYMSGCDLDTGAQAVVFILRDAAESGEALHERARATRAETRELYDHQRALMAEQWQVTREIQKRLRGKPDSAQPKTPDTPHGLVD